MPSSIQLFTIGFTQKSAEQFFETLIKSGIKTLIDTRLNNVSQLAGFAKKNDLKYFLKQIGGIDYIHITDLAPTKDILDDYKKNKGDWGVYEEKFLKLISELCRLLDNGYQISQNCLLIMSFSQPFQKSEDTELMCHRLIAGVIELTGDEFCPIAELILEVDQEIERVGWSKEQCIEYLIHNFQKRSRTLMKLEESHEFLTYLRKLPDHDM